MSRFVLLLLCVVHIAIAHEWEERPEWSTYFGNTEGCIAILDERCGARLAYHATRAEEEFIPASTYKVPHALFALEAGLVHDEFEVIPWDGVERWRDVWNCDQTLRSSMRHSTLWVYQGFARALGTEREREFMQRVGYGNANPGGDIETFWVEGDLRISAVGQVGFLQRLYRNALPIQLAHQRLVKDILIQRAEPAWVLRAKSGWSGTIAWWVGWVERAEGAVFFALNIDTPNRFKDLPQRETIALGILGELGVFSS